MPAGSPLRCAADAVPGALVDGEFVPDWLTAADVPWLRDLLLGAEAFDGRPFAALRAAWRQSEVPPRAGARWRPVLQVLQRRLLPRASGAATALRARVFAAAAAGVPRALALAQAGAAAGLAAADVEAALFADRGEQRAVRWPQGLDPDALRRATNGRFAQALLATATAAELTLLGASRAVLRTAWLHGAHFRWERSDGAAAQLAWRPPPGDGRAGRRLAAIVPVLPWARRFVLRARCRWRGVRCPFVLSTLDALPVGAAPLPFDSRQERELAAALVRAFVGWAVVREPAPLPVGAQLAFPDFGLWRHGCAEQPWWVELAGLRDRAALAGKVAVLLGCERYVLCVEERWVPPELAGHARVVAFRRGAVAAVVGRLLGVLGAG